jgi:hypothetical protein
MFLQANVVHKVKFDLTTSPSLMKSLLPLFMYAKTSFDGVLGLSGLG